MKQTAARPPTRILARTLDRLLGDPYRLALLVLALTYVIVFTRLAWDAHTGMRTHKADLGQIDQAVWNSSRGRWLEQTDNGFTATRLTDHVEPILVLISPMFWLWDDVRGLLLLQVIAVAAGVIPLYHLGLRRCEALLSGRQRDQIWLREPIQQLARPLAFALGVAYLLAPQLQSALLTEFHAAPLAVPLILWAFWAVDARRWGQVLVAAVLVALVKEEMALLAAGIGLWAAWRAWWDGRRAGHGADMAYGIGAGLAALLLGLAWFYVATFVIVPAYAQPLYGAAESTYFQRYGALGDSSADILRSLVTQPQVVWSITSEGPRAAYLLGLFVAFAFFPLIGFELVLLSLPLLLANLLSAYPAQYYGEFHYSAPLVPYFAAAAAYGLARLWRPLAAARGSVFGGISAPACGRYRDNGGCGDGAELAHGTTPPADVGTCRLAAGVGGRQLPAPWTRPPGRSLRSYPDPGTSQPPRPLHRPDPGQTRHSLRRLQCTLM